MSDSAGASVHELPDDTLRAMARVVVHAITLEATLDVVLSNLLDIQSILRGGVLHDVRDLTLTGKLAVLESLIPAELASEHHDVWRNLVDRCKQAAARRDELVYTVGVAQSETIDAISRELGGCQTELLERLLHDRLGET